MSEYNYAVASLEDKIAVMRYPINNTYPSNTYSHFSKIGPVNQWTYDCISGNTLYDGTPGCCWEKFRRDYSLFDTIGADHEFDFARILQNKNILKK